MLLIVVIIAALIWLGLLAQPWLPWLMRERFEAVAADASVDLSDVTVLIPARDEAATLGATLEALTQQGTGLRVIVIDDHSSDGTAEIARSAGLDNLTVIASNPLPSGWTGKLWALEQARVVVDTSRILLLDADIRLAEGTIAGLWLRARVEDLELVSLMASLRMYSPAERLLMPAFIYFFKLLYPFALSNAGSQRVAAAAGGCVFVKTETLDRIGGFAALADAVIDDCTLARRVREVGGRTWVGVSHAAVSLRGYDGLSAIHAMVARSAFTQLRYSTLLLVACSLVMALMFWVPLAGLLLGSMGTRTIAVIALVAMLVSYLPTLFYYRRNPAWALLLPVTGTIYLGMTWSSAWRYWRGVRTAWRGREYRREDTS